MNEKEQLAFLRKTLGEVVDAKFAEKEKHEAKLKFNKDRIPKTVNFGIGSTGDTDEPLIGKALQLIYQDKKSPGSAEGQLKQLGVMKALQEDTDSEGGYMVPSGYIAEVLRISNSGNLEPFCRHVPMNTKTVQFPNLETDVAVGGWVAEEGTIQESEPGLSQITLTAQKVGSLIKLSNELIQDSSPSVVEWLDGLFVGASSREVDAQALNGTGSPCSGITTDACGYSVVMETGEVNFSSITATHLSEMISKLSASVLPGCRFVVHPQVMHYIRTLQDSNGNYIYNSIAGAQAARLWGYPVVENDSMPDASDTGADTPFVVFGNFNYFLLGDRMRLSMDIDVYSMFDTDQARIRWLRRLAPKIGRADAFVRLMTAAS